MARQAAVKTTENAGDLARSPRVSKGPRPNKPWDYSRLRITLHSSDDLMEYMKGYPDPAGVILYLYRTAPRIDLSLIGAKETNIQKGSIADLGMFSIEAVAEKFRNGVYNVRMSDTMRPEGQKEMVKNCIYKVTDAGPAVYDIRTLELANSENIDEVNRQIAAGVLVRDANGAPRLRTQADGIPGNPLAFSSMMGGAGPAPIVNNDVIGRVLGNLMDRAATSPSETVKQAIELSRLITPAVDVEGAVERALERAGVKSGGAGSLESELATYERVHKLFRRFGAPSENSEGGTIAQDGWAPHLPSILSELNTLIPQVVGVWNHFAGNRGVAPAAGVGLGVPVTVTQTAAAPAPAAAQSTEAAAPLTLGQRIEEVFALGFDQMKKGAQGFDYASWVCMYYPGGLEVYRHLETNGTQGVMALLSMHPAGRAIANDAVERPKLEKFLDDFFTFDPDGIETESTAPAVGPNGAAAGATAAG